ncbi:MAG: hypothetical protein K0S20_519 [Patescibacteria group bacterium]|nr:hypothetical protein [Patescibacteria group bacterium]
MSLVKSHTKKYLADPFSGAKSKGSAAALPFSCLNKGLLVSNLINFSVFIIGDPLTDRGSRVKVT